jgi:hypothetical protein
MVLITLGRLLLNDKQVIMGTIKLIVDGTIFNDD